MPIGPQGQKHPADAIGKAVYIARIATGIFEKTTFKHPAKRESGLVNWTACQDNMMPEDREAIAKKAAAARWS